MSDFPPNLSIRPLTIEDLDQCISLENKGFDAHERCSPEKFKYRLTVCPELCSGLFIRDYNYKYNAINLPHVAEKLQQEHENKPGNNQSSNENDEEDNPDDMEDLPVKSSVTKESLIGHIIGTKIYYPRVTSASMDLPSEQDQTSGHIENSRYIGIHSLVVDPEWQGKNLGTLLMHDYIQKLSNQDLGDKVALLAKDDLVPFYEKIGFNNLGQSQCKFANTNWNDLSMDLIPEDDE